MGWSRLREHAAPLACLLAAALVPLGAGPWTGHVPWFSDLVNVDNPIRCYVRACLARNEFPFWNPHAACGLPFLADPNTALFYPPTWLLLLLDPPIGMVLDIAMHLFAAGALTYATVRVRGADRVAATFAGVAFALSGAVFVQIQLPGNLRALALAPAVVLGTAMIARRRTAAGFVVAAVAWALAVVAGHPQLAACALPVAAAVAWDTTDPTRRGRFRALAIAATAVGVGTLVAGVALAPAAEFVAITQRSLGVSAAFRDAGSLGPVDLAHTVFARSEFVDHLALGVAVPAFAALAVTLRIRGSAVLTAAAAFGVLASFGDATFVGRALHFVPPYAYFQGPSRHFGSATLALCLLAGDGFAAWRGAATSTRTRPMIAAALVAVVAVAFVVSPGAPTSHDLLKFAAIAAVVAAFVVGPRIAPAALIVLLAAADLALEDGRACWRDDHVAMVAAADALPATLAATPADAHDGSYRILTGNVPWHWHNRPTAFGIDNARGHVAFTPLRLLDLTHVVEEGTLLPRAPLDNPLYSYAPTPGSSPLADLYAVRYAVGFSHAPTPQWRSVAPGVFERDCRMREAEFVREARFVATEGDAAAALLSAGFDPTRTVVIEGEADSAAVADAGDDARVVEIRRRADGVHVRLAPGRAGWLVASWNHLPGFEATVDGAGAEVRMANVAFMAVRLPAGARELDLRYRPPGLALGACVSAGGVLALALGAWLLAKSDAGRQAASTNSCSRKSANAL